MPAFTGFTGEYSQRVDGKGRMSIPADLRRVLEAGDPDWTEGLSPNLRLLYGPQLKDHLQVYTIQAFNEIAAAIQSVRPKNEEEEEAKEIGKRLILGKSARLEVDKDGRVVLPLVHRQKIGLTEGEVMFSGVGDYFEVWAAETYDARISAAERAYLEKKKDGWDPMTSIWAALGG